jgi:tetratricopeptide (TPR) repeat protein
MHDVPLSPDQLSIIALADAYIALDHSEIENKTIVEALANFRRTLQAASLDADALHSLGLQCSADDQFELARVFFSAAFLASPERGDICEHCGLVTASAGALETAEAFYRRALKSADQTATIHRNLADCLRLSRHLEEAMLHYSSAVEIDPDLRHAWRALAQISYELGHLDNAMEFWMRAWALHPAAPKDDLDQIVAIVETNHTRVFDETIEQITTRFSADAAALKAVSYVLNSSQLYQRAAETAQQALAIEPHNAVLCHHMAWALRQLGHVAQSLPYCRKAANALIDNPKVQYSLAETLLCLGEFEEGWKLNAAFHQVPENKATLLWPEGPVWNGEPVAGRHFLMVGEQGLGDQIQFLRFADWLHQRGAVVDLLADQRIVELAASMPSIRSAFSTMPASTYDFWAHMFRIPEHVNLHVDMLPVSMPYLCASPEKLAEWQPRLEKSPPERAAKASRRVGIVWSGNPLLRHDHFRSIPLHAFEDLFRLSGISWFALQKGSQERDADNFELEFDIQTLGPLIHGYADTLAILQSLDLLITVDSSVAHLAGAAGLPVWTLIPAYTDWRWMTDRTDSPWYPSMRLFRQRELGQWDPVIHEVRQALVDWRGNRPVSP